ncbi:hypothetical protein GCM10029963_35840 [Micromonospora andamanensis]|nr:hypothetical protein [Micromonospora andamanensis]GIJ40104.1 hypothetical protein Vwe01_34290 [Micromonospora andamanensis]
MALAARGGGEDLQQLRLVGVDEDEAVEAGLEEYLEIKSIQR